MKDTPDCTSSEYFSISDEECDEKDPFCNMCKFAPMIASHECLACKAFCCWPCADEHIKNLRFAHHKMIPLGSKLLCSRHNQEMILYCMDCLRCICVACAQFSVDHSGHKVLDFESASSVLRPQIELLENQLEDMKSQTDLKMKKYDEERIIIKQDCEGIENNMRKIVKEIMTSLETELTENVQKLLELRDDRLLKIDFERQKASDLATQLYKLSIPKCAKDQVTDFLHRAKDILEVPIHPANDYTLDENDIQIFKTFHERGSCALDALFYSELSLTSRWECRACKSKNFPKETVCRACQTPNRFLERLQAPNNASKVKRGKPRRI